MTDNAAMLQGAQSPRRPGPVDVDLILVGGGLANSLIAWRLLTVRPELRLLVLEREARLGGNHIWSFHDSDLTAAQRGWIGPLVTRSWPHYDVRFPDFTRRLHGGYHCISSMRLDAVVGEALGDRVRLGAQVAAVTATGVELADGSRIDARAVVDGRGAVDSPHLTVAYQKFLGQQVRLAGRHGLSGPLLMDATVAQVDGFRFLYVLPLDDDVVLVEDTRYSDDPELDSDALRAQVQRYARAAGWTVAAVEREEQGVLPIVLAGDIEGFWAEAPAAVARSGLRACLFHATTGYSLPDAVRLADEIAASPTLDGVALDRLVRQRSREGWRRQAFFRLLNRMLFVAAAPSERFRVLQRFYALPEPLIARFYAGRLSLTDRIRLLSGSPPVPVHRALGCLSEASVRRRRPAIALGVPGAGR